jgi:glycosyltransferase involved in cell wall biosynthesis
MAAIYSGASAFALASSYEGFGLSVLEAMQFALPVACSNRGSLREVAGEAARFFDPDDPDDIDHALHEVMLNEVIRERLTNAIPENLKRFSWEKCAHETVEVFSHILSDGVRAGRLRSLL